MGRAVPTETSLRLVKAGQDQAGVFGPDDIAVITTAFDQILFDLKLTDRNDPVVTIIAKLVIRLVRNGERDVEQLRKQVVAQQASLDNMAAAARALEWPRKSSMPPALKYRASPKCRSKQWIT